MERLATNQSNHLLYADKIMLHRSGLLQSDDISPMSAAVSRSAFSVGPDVFLFRQRSPMVTVTSHFGSRLYVIQAKPFEGFGPFPCLDLCG